MFVSTTALWKVFWFYPQMKRKAFAEKLLLLEGFWELCHRAPWLLALSRPPFQLPHKLLPCLFSKTFCTYPYSYSHTSGIWNRVGAESWKHLKTGFHLQIVLLKCTEFTYTFKKHHVLLTHDFQSHIITSRECHGNFSRLKKQILAFGINYVCCKKDKGSTYSVTSYLIYTTAIQLSRKETNLLTKLKIHQKFNKLQIVVVFKIITSTIQKAIIMA